MNNGTAKMVERRALRRVLAPFSFALFLVLVATISTAALL